MAGEMILLCGVLYLAELVASQATGECQLAGGSTGWCRALSQCPPIQASTNRGIPKLCSVDEDDPVVCCPTTVDHMLRNNTKPVPNTVQVPTGVIGCGLRSTIFSNNFGFRRHRRAVQGLADVDIFAVAGGRDAIREAWPWMALMGQYNADGKEEWYCSGTLINNRWILTAAHCITKGGDPAVIRLGEHDHSTTTDDANHMDYQVSQVILHPEFQAQGLFSTYHDLALIQLSEQVQTASHIQAVCLPWGEEAHVDLVGSSVTVTGWGDTEFGGDGSAILQEGEVDVFPIDKCDADYKVLPSYSATYPSGLDKSKFLCAGKAEGGVDTCQGDSGGPLMSYDSKRNVYLLRGVVSHGVGCGLKQFPGLYAPMSNAGYLQWIKDIAFTK